MKEKPSETIRLDKQLWAARSYKARALAQEMIGGGRVHCNGQRSKPGEIVELDAMLTLRQGNDERMARVVGITKQCRSASEVVALYGETTESTERRKKMALARKVDALTMPYPDRRPDKKERHDLMRFKHDGSEQFTPEGEVIMTQHDQSHHYLFENYVVRGKLVTVSETLEQTLANHTCPQPAKTVLAEPLVATSLLTATPKFASDITAQLQGDGPLQLTVINDNNQQQLRDVAYVWDDIADGADLKTMVDSGHPVITTSPKEGECYQDMVGLGGDTLVACLGDYLQRSEQLPARPIIRTGEYEGQPMTSGMLLQVMPAQDTQTADFKHLATLTETVKAEELFTLPANGVLWHLYYEEKATVYEPQSTGFKYTCSRKRCAGALKTLPNEEIDNILVDEGEVGMHYDYRDNRYISNAMNIAEIHNNASPADPQVH